MRKLWRSILRSIGLGRLLSQDFRYTFVARTPPVITRSPIDPYAASSRVEIRPEGVREARASLRSGSHVEFHGRPGIDCEISRLRARRSLGRTVPPPKPPS